MTQPLRPRRRRRRSALPLHNRPCLCRRMGVAWAAARHVHSSKAGVLGALVPGRRTRVHKVGTHLRGRPVVAGVGGQALQQGGGMWHGVTSLMTGLPRMGAAQALRAWGPQSKSAMRGMLGGGAGSGAARAAPAPAAPRAAVAGAAVAIARAAAAGSAAAAAAARNWYLDGRRRGQEALQRAQLAPAARTPTPAIRSWQAGGRQARPNSSTCYAHPLHRVAAHINHGPAKRRRRQRKKEEEKRRKEEDELREVLRCWMDEALGSQGGVPVAPSWHTSCRRSGRSAVC